MNEREMLFSSIEGNWTRGHNNRCLSAWRIGGHTFQVSIRWDANVPRQSDAFCRRHDGAQWHVISSLLSSEVTGDYELMERWLLSRACLILGIETGPTPPAATTAHGREEREQ